MIARILRVLTLPLIAVLGGLTGAFCNEAAGAWGYAVSVPMCILGGYAVGDIFRPYTALTELFRRRPKRVVRVGPSREWL